jgi:hypothetical protein
MKLMKDAKKFFGFHSDYENATKKGNEGRIDKYNKGFNADDRFKSFSANVYFSAYTGSYGSSSVGNFLHLESGDEITSAFIQYLRDNEHNVIKGIGQILEAKAKSLTDKARVEIESAQEKLLEIEEHNNKH